MINRDALEGIVKSLDTGTLIEMLASKGLHIGEESPLYSTEDEGNTQGWNNIKIDLGHREKRPPIHSPETYLKPRVEEQHNKPEYMASETPPDLEPWAAQGAQQ